MYNMMYGYGYGGPDFFIFHAFEWVFWIVLIVIVVRLLAGGRRHWRHRGWFEDSAMNVLKERYAKGEISKEEFEAKKKDLMS